MAILIDVIVDGKPEQRELDYMKVQPRGRPSIPVPVLRRSEKLLVLIAGSPPYIVRDA